MPILPKRIQDLLDFCELHGHVWEDAPPAQIGLTAGQVAAFKAAAAAVRDRYNERLAAIDAAKAATVASTSALAEVRTVAASLLALIKAFAASQAEPITVYTLAQVRPPAAPSPAPPPGQAADFRAILNGDGSITLRWRSSRASTGGTVWTIKRKLPAETGYTFVGAPGTRSFTDATIPAGAASAAYMITGQRAGSVGPTSPPFTVLFGRAAGGGLTIRGHLTGESPVMMAA